MKSVLILLSSPQMQKPLLEIIDQQNENLAFGQVNVNSLRNKSDVLSDQMKRYIDMQMISETKLESSFPENHFIIGGNFIINRNKYVSGVREDIPAKPLSYDFLFIESFFVDTNLHKLAILIRLVLENIWGYTVVY